MSRSQNYVILPTVGYSTCSVKWRPDKWHSTVHCSKSGSGCFLRVHTKTSENMSTYHFVYRSMLSSSVCVWVHHGKCTWHVQCMQHKLHAGRIHQYKSPLCKTLALKRGGCFLRGWRLLRDGLILCILILQYFYYMYGKWWGGGGAVWVLEVSCLGSFEYCHVWYN